MKKTGRLLNCGMLGRLFFTYLCILVFPLIFTVVLYIHTARLLTEEAKESNLRMLEQSRIVTEGQIKEMELLITRLADNNHVLQFMNLKNPQLSEKIELISGMWKDFSSISFANGTVEEFYIWFKENDCIITPDARYTTREYYKSYLEDASGLSYEEWMGLVTSKEAYISYSASYPIQKRGVTCPVMDFSLSLPFGSRENLGASIHVLLSQKAVQAPLAQVGARDGDEYYILTSDGRVVTAKPGSRRPETVNALPADVAEGYFTQKMDGEKMLVSFERSSKNGWIYLSVQPVKGILYQTENLRNIFIVMLVLCVAVGCGISVLLSWWMSFPIRKMLRQVREYKQEAASTERGDVLVLENAIHKLMDENAYVRKEIQQHLPILKNNFAVKLLQGKAEDENEIELGMEQAGITLFGRRYGVALLYISGYKGSVSKEILMELSAVKAMIHGLAAMNQLLSLALEADLEDCAVAYVVPFKETEEDLCALRLAQAAEELQESLFRAAGIRAVCFTGKTVDCIARISLSYEEARQKMDRYVISGETALGNPDAPVETYGSRYSYSMETEMRLMLLCRDGKIGEVREILDSVYESNIKGGRLDKESLFLLLCEMKGTIYKLLDGIPMAKRRESDICNELEKLGDCDFTAIGSIYEELCDTVKDNKSHQSEKLKEELISYIGGHYTDSEFYMVTLAEHFNLSESFLFAFIKENLNTNFSAYVQNLRLTKACALLKETSKNIDVIAAETGYSSSHVFRRAFKRQYGVNPNQYRECLQEKRG